MLRHSMPRVVVLLMATAGAVRADTGHTDTDTDHADAGLPLGSVFAEQRSVTLPPVVFAPTAGQTEQTQTVAGTFPRGARDWVYLPIDVPNGVREIAVDYQYDRPTVPPGERGNALDIGIFDESGIGLDNARGFRGWSGGFRTSFAISASDATPGYLPGPVRKGRWHVIFGPYSVAPQGLTWTVHVTLRYGEPGPAGPRASASASPLETQSS